MKVFGGDGRATLLALPAMGLGAVLAAALLGLAERPVRSAQVLSGPNEGAGVSGRLLLTEEFGGVLRPASGLEVLVAFSSGEIARETIVRAGEDGVADFALPAVGEPAGAVVEGNFPGRGKTRRWLVVTERSSGEVLAEGEPSLSPDAYRRAPRRGGRLVMGSRAGERVEVLVERGVLAVPFDGKVRLVALAPFDLGGRPFRASLRGGTLRGPKEFLLSADHPVELDVVAEEHRIELALEVELPGGERRTLLGSLPVVPGAFGLAVEGDVARILSPLPRTEAYYTFLTERRRLASGRVSLISRPDGTSVGTLPLPTALPPSEAPFLVLASDADGRSPSTVGYALSPYRATLDAVDERVLDGSSAARAREKRRLARVRSALLAYGAFVFLTTVFLFLRLLRREGRLARDLLTSSGLRAEVVSPGGPVLAAAFVLVVGMSAALVWAALVGPF